MSRRQHFVSCTWISWANICHNIFPILEAAFASRRSTSLQIWGATDIEQKQSDCC